MESQSRLVPVGIPPNVTEKNRMGLLTNNEGNCQYAVGVDGGWDGVEQSEKAAGQAMNDALYIKKFGESNSDDNFTTRHLGITTLSTYRVTPLLPPGLILFVFMFILMCLSYLTYLRSPVVYILRRVPNFLDSEKLEVSDLKIAIENCLSISQGLGLVLTVSISALLTHIRQLKVLAIVCVVSSLTGLILMLYALHLYQLLAGAVLFTLAGGIINAVAPVCVLYPEHVSLIATVLTIGSFSSMIPFKCLSTLIEKYNWDSQIAYIIYITITHAPVVCLVLAFVPLWPAWSYVTMAHQKLTPKLLPLMGYESRIRGNCHSMDKHSMTTFEYDEALVIADNVEDIVGQHSMTEARPFFSKSMVIPSQWEQPLMKKLCSVPFISFIFWHYIISSCLRKSRSLYGECAKNHLPDTEWLLVAHQSLNYIRPICVLLFFYLILRLRQNCKLGVREICLAVQGSMVIQLLLLKWVSPAGFLVSSLISNILRPIDEILPCLFIANVFGRKGYVFLIFCSVMVTSTSLVLSPFWRHFEQTVGYILGFSSLNILLFLAVFNVLPLINLYCYPCGNLSYKLHMYAMITPMLINPIALDYVFLDSSHKPVGRTKTQNDKL